jgi:trimeric autotransporter adhesin/endosialidase-like protein
MNRHTRTLVLILLGPALLGPPTSVIAQTALLEVDKGEVKLMQVNDDGGLLVRGTETGAIPASGSGARLMWYPRKFAFRAGTVSGTEWDDANVGVGSVAMGFHTTASGENSTAMGGQTEASGPGSTAIGIGTTAVGEASTAMGLTTTASGPFSTVMGQATTASGIASTAMGHGTTARGIASTAMGSETTALADYSTVMGRRAQTSATATGSFVYGDASTTDIVATSGPNEFIVRAAGGVAFFSNATRTAGVALASGGGAWSTASDIRRKQHLRAESGERILARLATLPIPSWSYRAQPDRIRHLGPSAQDFRAAFGLGESDTTITTTDADGVALLAIQALERRTAELREENADLRRRLEVLEGERAAGRK